MLCVRRQATGYQSQYILVILDRIDCICTILLQFRLDFVSQLADVSTLIECIVPENMKSIELIQRFNYSDSELLEQSFSG